MYGGSGKLGRGGGAAALGKRNIHSTFQPSHIQRPSSGGGGRLSAGHRNRSNTPVTAAVTASAADETFSLVTSNPLNFAMIIRLAPDLVDEIKRVEAQGGAAKIKFDDNPNNPSGNVIDVGGKDFRFTWSRETGDLCDIYEERRSGEDGNGLLVESGGAWRKLNVHRVLDESTKNHVKMRSEEAERKHKSRKAIVLEPGNPSVKNQKQALAAAEVTTWRLPFKQKKEPPFKKMKTEPTSGGPPKFASKSGFSSTTPSKVRASASPLLSTPEQSGAPLSPLRTSSLTKGYASIEDAMPRQAMSKENTSVSEKEMTNRVSTGGVQDKPGSKGKLGAKPTDLRSLLISLLMEKPQGMNLKALEKAIGDTTPKSVRQIEPILKKIAVFQAPGRYFLKSEVELKNFKKPLSESGSSPEDNHHQRPVPAPEPSFSLKANNKELEENAQLISKPVEELNTSEKMDIEHHSPDQFGEKKVSDNSEGPAVSSSASGSDSDSESDSSDSASDSGSPSRSKSRSPVGSGSGSSSDGESDVSSNSKEGSDEDVDIMSDDDKEPNHKLQHSEPGLLTPPIPWRAPEVELVHNVVEEKDDTHGSDVVEIEKDLPEDNQEADMAVVTNSFSNKGGDRPAEETKTSIPDCLEHLEGEVHTRNWSSERENVAKDGFKNVQSDNSERIISKSKSKRGSDGKHFDDDSERTKKLKQRNSIQQAFSAAKNSLFAGSPQGISPDRPIEGSYKGPTTQAPSKTLRDVTDYDFKRGNCQEVPSKSISDSPKSSRRFLDLNAREKAPAAIERLDKYAEGLGRVGDVKYSDRTLQMHDGLSMQKDMSNTEIQDEDGQTMEKRPPKSSRLGVVGDKHSDSHYRKHGALVGKFKEAGSISNSQIRNSPKENYRTDMVKSPVTNGRGITLQRELSDLEMGELRETLHEEPSGAKKRFERNSSFKQSETKTSADYWNSDVVKGKPAGRSSVDSAKASPPHSSIGISSNPESLFKKRTPQHYVEDLTRPHQKAMQVSRVDHAEAGCQHNKLAEMSSKVRHNEAGVSQNVGLEGYGDAQRKASVCAPQQHESQQGVSLSARENRRQKSNALADSSEKRKDASLLESNDGGQNRRESSSDENSSSYTKYEKEEPELKRPIKDISQYKEYIQEYREKYDSYRSLNKVLEVYRNEFQNFGRDLELAKGRDNDRYYKILGQLVESYRQCGPRHKRLKKIFVVLHHELQHLKEMITDFSDSHTKG